MAWGKTVTKFVLDIMKYYTGGGWSYGGNTTGEGGNSGGTGGDLGNVAEGFLGIAQDYIKYLAKNGYGYTDGTSNGLTVAKKYYTKGQASHGNVDCSSYACGVIYSYGYKKNISELMNFKYINSGGFLSMAQRLAKGSTSGTDKYFKSVWTTSSTNSQGLSDVYSVQKIHELLQPGDIFVYRRGNSHHVDIFAGWKTQMIRVVGEY